MKKAIFGQNRERKRVHGMLRAFFFPLLILFRLLFPAPTLGHELPPTVVDIEFREDRLVMSMPMILEELIIEMRISEEPDLDPMVLSEEYDRLRALPPEALAESFVPYERSFIEDFTILAGDTKTIARITEVRVAPVGDLSLPRESFIHAEADLPADDSHLRIGWGEENGILIIRQGGNADGFSEALANGALTRPIGRDGTVQSDLMSSIVNYVVIGFRHIFPDGYDHILFVLGLMLFAMAWRPIIWQVSTFTIAHTITIFLAALGLVSVPAMIVEPLIAASITVVAIENVMAVRERASLQRLGVIFIFGLLHGLGFAGSLSEIGLDPWHLITSLVAFNIGVELGQLFVIGCAFILLALICRLLNFPLSSGRFHAYISAPISILIGSIGAWWFIERVASSF